MALFWALVMKIAMAMPENSLALPMVLMGEAGVRINVVLMVLNLFPLPPLDGGRIAVSLLPRRLAWRYAMVEPYGMIILVVLLFSGVLGVILWPLIAATVALISTLFGL
jgi:Zn-dependent protease